MKAFKVVALLVITFITVFLGVSIYDYNFGDGDDWITHLDQSGEVYEVKYTKGVMPPELPHFYSDGSPIIWDAVDQWNYVQDSSRVTYELVPGDSTRCKWILIDRVFTKGFLKR